MFPEIGFEGSLNEIGDGPVLFSSKALQQALQLRVASDYNLVPGHASFFN
jgi:hypothetical protein